jgi:predicted thioesterase
MTRSLGPDTDPSHPSQTPTGGPVTVIIMIGSVMARRNTRLRVTVTVRFTGKLTRSPAEVPRTTGVKFELVT